MILTSKARRVLLFLTAVSILVVSLIPRAPRILSSVPHIDKLEHFIAYSALGFFLALDLALRLKKKLHFFLAAIAFCIVYGAVIEFLQQYTGRSPELLDLAADMAGSGAGAALATLVNKG